MDEQATSGQIGIQQLRHKTISRGQQRNEGLERELDELLTAPARPPEKPLAKLLAAFDEDDPVQLAEELITGEHASAWHGHAIFVTQKVAVALPCLLSTHMSQLF